MVKISNGNAGVQKISVSLKIPKLILKFSVYTSMYFKLATIKKLQLIFNSLKIKANLVNISFLFKINSEFNLIL